MPTSPTQLGLGNVKDQQAGKWVRKRTWETAKLSRGGAERVKQRWWGGMEQTWIFFPFVLAAAELCPPAQEPPPGSVAPAKKRLGAFLF